MAPVLIVRLRLALLMAAAPVPLAPPEEVGRPRCSACLGKSKR